MDFERSGRLLEDVEQTLFRWWSTEMATRSADSRSEAAEAPDVLQGLRLANAMRQATLPALPLITVVALSYGSLLEGSELVETIFSWPGIGNYLASSLFRADMNAVLGGTFVVRAAFVFLNMLSDALYNVLDSRLHRGQS